MEDRPLFDLPDEDALVLPDSWRRVLHPRRGGAPGPRIKVDPAAPETVAALIGKAEWAIGSLLRAEVGDPALAEAARRYLEGTDDPAGAAVVAVLCAWHRPTRADTDRMHRAFIDAWVIRHGVAFAACALVELLRTRPVGEDGGRCGAAHHEDDEVTWVALENMRRVRGLLAAADERDHAAAVDRLAAHRTDWTARWGVSYLVPTRDDWVDECCSREGVRARPDGLYTEALSALGKVEQLTRPYPWASFRRHRTTRDLLATLVDGLGSGALPLLVKGLDDRYLEEDDRKRLFETIAVLPADEAFQVLLDRRGEKHATPALVEATRRFPARALRLFARAGAGDLLRTHVGANPELVAAVLPDLPDDVAVVVRAAAESSVRVPEAGPEELPEVLADPPWLRPRRPVVTGLGTPAARMAWRDGERRAWLDSDPDIPPPEGENWEELVEAYRNGKYPYFLDSLRILVHGPEDRIRPFFAERSVRTLFGPWMRVLAARYELDARYLVTEQAAKSPARHADLLMPFLDAEAARLAAGWFARSDASYEPGRRWLDRHGPDAVPLLVPAALGEEAKRWREAETALRHIRDACGLDGVVAAAWDAHGDEAAAAIEELLSAPPARTGLERPARPGAWANPKTLPQVLLRGRERALPADATGRLIELLTLPTPQGTDELMRVCEPASLAEFGWAVFDTWRQVGSPAEDGWALTQLGRTGDDGTVRRLTPLIRAWPGQSAHKNAVKGLGVLAEIGTDVALANLHGIAQKVRFKGLKAQAQERIGQVADRLGLSTEQLADRLVPVFGLDPDGSRTLDYGPRRFTVRFDEQLKPVVTDENGKPRRTLPKPGAKDDPEKAPAAHQAFAALKKDVRTVASGQLARLESAMTTQRRWTPAEFGEFIVRHPLVWHIARRLVWIAEHDGTATAFRIAEDRTFADLHDDAFPLPGEARVGIAHPLHLGGALEAWAEVFADYELLQPFPQLARPVHGLTDEERTSERLARFEGLKAPYGRVLGLERRGWERGEPGTAGEQAWISRRVPGGRHVVIGLDPGFTAGEPDAPGGHQLLERVWFTREPGDHRPERSKPLEFGGLDPVTASEILTDLIELQEAAE